MPLGVVLRVCSVQNIVNFKVCKATETKIIFYSREEILHTRGYDQDLFMGDFERGCGVGGRHKVLVLLVWGGGFMSPNRRNIHKSSL